MHFLFQVIPYYHTLLDVRFDERGGDLLLIWPATIVHEINETSPFYLKSAEDMLRERFEVVVILEGTIESTGQSIQARSSYIASEILWGHRFDQVKLAILREFVPLSPTLQAPSQAKRFAR